jgi:hypothetical protein
MEQTLPPTPSTPPAGGLRLAARLRAAAVHLALSALVAGLAALLVFGLWFPTPFREISGGRELFFLVVAVDVVLGPLITLAVFDRRKPWRELRRDLAIVVLMQLGALGYGLHTVFLARPVVLALETDRLRVVTAADLQEADLSAAPPEWRRLPWAGLHLLATRQASADEQFIAISLALQGVDLGMRPEFWLPAGRTAAALRDGARPLAALAARYPERKAELQHFVDATGRRADQLKYLPLLARRSDWVALVDARSGEVAGYAPFDGF